MKRCLYGERDYAFGQMMLTLRTHIGLTQAGLAELLGVSRRAVAEWEAGSSYPKTERFKQLIVLGVRADAKGTSGSGPVAQVQPGWLPPGQLRGRWRYQRLGVGERRASADTAA